MDWFFGHAEIDGEMHITEPRQLESADEAERIGAWPGMFTSSPYESETEARKRIEEMAA